MNINLFGISARKFTLFFKGLPNPRPAFSYLYTLRRSKGSQAVLRAKRAEALRQQSKEVLAPCYQAMREIKLAAVVKPSGLTNVPEPITPIAQAKQVVYF
jgi:hypothetical protein